MAYSFPSINRIRLEFKGVLITVQVLIESDWNLKDARLLLVISYPLY